MFRHEPCYLGLGHGTSLDEDLAEPAAGDPLLASVALLVEDRLEILLRGETVPHE
ncbi:MAG TPA: hypothetical protein VI409_00685 [Gaiellaceae bacterium]|nr:hypothetical protein [Gaiellaceae bacterium]